MSNFWRQLAELQERQACVLVTLLSVTGSAPQCVGARMAVHGSGILGSIGGGRLEFSVSEYARSLLHDGSKTHDLQSYTLGASFGQCCGGKVLISYEVLMRRPYVAIFGSGHVGLELGLILARLPVNLQLYDNVVKATSAVEETGLTVSYDDDLPTVAARLPELAWAIVLTHSHQLDFELVHTLLQRDDLSFVGLIGSASKRKNFTTRLQQRGLASAAIDRLVCPLGTSAIASKQPAAIAVATVAQLLELGLLAS